MITKKMTLFLLTVTCIGLGGEAIPPSRAESGVGQAAGGSQAQFPYEAKVIQVPEGLSDDFVWLKVTIAPPNDSRLGKIYWIHPDKLGRREKPSEGQAVGIPKIRDYHGDYFVLKKHSSGEETKDPNPKAFVNTFEVLAKKSEGAGESRMSKTTGTQEKQIALNKTREPLTPSPEFVQKAESKGLFVVEAKIGKDGKAFIVRTLYTPQEQQGAPDALKAGQKLALEPNQNKHQKGSQIRWKIWHKLVDKRVEILVTPAGTVDSWKEIGTGRRMGRSVKKFFGGGTALFSSSRKKVTKAEGE
jgi:hypothetical protein